MRNMFLRHETIQYIMVENEQNYEYTKLKTSKTMSVAYAEGDVVKVVLKTSKTMRRPPDPGPPKNDL